MRPSSKEKPPIDVLLQNTRLSSPESSSLSSSSLAACSPHRSRLQPLCSSSLSLWRLSFRKRFRHGIDIEGHVSAARVPGALPKCRSRSNGLGSGAKASGAHPGCVQGGHGAVQQRLETQKITIFNAGTQGVKIAAGFSTIIVKVTEYTARLAGSAYGYTPSPLPDADAKLVVESLTTFVKVHQALLNVVIGKHGITTLFPFFEPIRVSLVNLEVVIDTFAFYLIDLIPTQKPAAEDQFSALSVTLGDAKKTYSNAARLPKTDKPLVDTINDAIKEITDLSDNLRKETEQINTFNAPKQGYKIAEGFNKLIQNVIEASTALEPGTSSANPSPLDDDAAKTVVKTLTTFVQVHQALLNVVIGKHGVLTLIPFFEPIRLALVQLEIVVDTFAFNLINLIPTQQAAASKQIASLDVTIRDAVNTYSSPLSKTAQSVHAIEGLIDH